MSGYDVFILGGQSNMVGTQATPAIDLVNDVGGAHVYQMRQAANGNAVIAGDDPLEHGGVITSARTSSSSIGFAVAFARWYRDNMAASGRDILLVPCAIGGTGFSNSNWNPGNSLYETMVSRANIAMAKDAGNKLVALLWHQGEQDGGAGWTAAQYTTAFAAMVADFRIRVTGGNKCRVITGGLAPGPVAANGGGWQQVQNALIAMQTAVVGCAHASSAGLSGDNSLDIHFTAASERLFGPVYGAALQAICPYPSTAVTW